MSFKPKEKKNKPKEISVIGVINGLILTALAINLCIQKGARLRSPEPLSVVEVPEEINP